MDKIQNAEEVLKKYNQNSVYKLLKNLDSEKSEILAESILDTDFEYITNVFKENQKPKDLCSKAIIPMSATVKENLSEAEKAKIYNLGKTAIQNGEYAVVTMAGGQGTRLNHKGPKGTFKLQTMYGEKYIFEILCESMKRLNSEFGVQIPWYIMTSEDNNKATVDFFEEHNYFGLNKDSVKFFIQAKMPIMNTAGEVLVGEDYKVKQAADGNGSLFSSIRKAGILDEFEKKNIKWVFSCGVDNILVNMADPYLVGLSIYKNCKIATKSIVKSSPTEKIGVICKQDDRIKVIEYSELPETMANQRKDNNELLFSEAHVMFNLFSIDAIKESSTYKMPYHSAFKKNNYLDENGKLVVAEAPNSYKFESFIFDSFELFDDIAILRGKREEEFSPIKNATGVDSPETAVNLYNNFWKNKA